MNKGVLLQTADKDYTGFFSGQLRDDDVSTCLTIPLQTASQRYLKARMSWPVSSGSTPNYNVTIKGSNLMCDPDHLIVYMNVKVVWGNPSFKGEVVMCKFISQSDDSSLITCLFACRPDPEFSAGVFVYMRNFGDMATICEVEYSQ